MVYVINQEGNPLMPTRRYGNVRRMLRDGEARVVRCVPFTITLLRGTTAYTQPVTLGVDAGSRFIGLSATTAERELFSAEIELRTDVTKLLSARREARRTRRGRLRYRAPRFDNRTASKKEGWLAPSVDRKVESHLSVIGKIHRILPVSRVIIEVASFDTQRIKDDSVTGFKYQRGDMLGFWNTREYVLCRDSHTCQGCKGKSRDSILNVHHIESRQTGGDSPSNLVTLCETCHKAYHKGILPLDLKRGKSLRDAAFMSVMRWAVHDRLRATYKDVRHTYGYLTKNTRIERGLPKSHHADALCITGNSQAVPLPAVHHGRFTRRHNRRIHKSNRLKGGRLKPNQAPYMVRGFRLFDKVLYKGQECFIFGRRASGSFDIRLLDGTKVHAGINCNKLRLIEKSRTLLLTRKEEPGQFLTRLKTGVSLPKIS